MGKGFSDKAWNERGRMLTITIHGQRMGKARSLGVAQAVQNRCALATIERQHKYPQLGIDGGESLDRRAAVVGAAVDHHPYRRPVAARFNDGFQELGARVIARNDNDVGMRCMLIRTI